MSNGIASFGGMRVVEAVLPGVARGVSPAVAGAAEPAVVTASVTMPAYRIDPALGLVITELHEGPGTALTTIPTGRQIEAYRQTQSQAAGTEPAAARSAAAAKDASRDGAVIA